MGLIGFKRSGLETRHLASKLISDADDGSTRSRSAFQVTVTRPHAVYMCDQWELISQNVVSLELLL
jgi:hypothetical protein